MTKKNCPAIPDFWAQAHFKHLTQPPRDEQAKHLTSVRSRDFERLIIQVIQPLLADIGTQNAVAQWHLYAQMADKLHDVAMKWDRHEFAEFPQDGGKQLILDRLDTLESLMRKAVGSLNYVEIDSDDHGNIFLDFRTRQERRAA